MANIRRRFGFVELVRTCLLLFFKMGSLLFFTLWFFFLFSLVLIRLKNIICWFWLPTYFFPHFSLFMLFAFFWWKLHFYGDIRLWGNLGKDYFFFLFWFRYFNYFIGCFNRLDFKSDGLLFRGWLEEFFNHLWPNKVLIVINLRLFLIFI